MRATSAHTTNSTQYDKWQCLTQHQYVYGMYYWLNVHSYVEICMPLSTKHKMNLKCTGNKMHNQSDTLSCIFLKTEGGYINFELLQSYEFTTYEFYAAKRTY